MMRSRRFALAVFAVLSTALAGPVAAAPTSFESAPIGIVAQPFHVYTPVNARFTLRLPSAVTRSARIRFKLNRKVANRDSFRAIADHFAEPGVIDEVSVPVRRGVSGDNGTSFDVLVTTVESGRNSLFLPQVGVYPLTIEAVGADGALLGTTLTFLDRRDVVAPAPAVSTTVLASLTAPLSITPDGDLALQDPARRAVSDFVDFLGGATTPVTVLIQPELIEALSQSVDIKDAELFGALRDALAGRRIPVMTYVPVDVPALVHDGLADRVTDVVNLARSTLAEHLPGIVLQDTVWVSRDSLDDQTVSFLRNLGFTTLVLLAGGSQGVEREAATALLSRPAGTSNNSLAVIHADEQVATTVDAATDDPVRSGYRIAAEVLALRDDILATGAAPDRVRIVVSSSSGDLIDGPTLRTALRALSSAPGISLREIAGSETVNDLTPATVFPQSQERSMGGLKNSIVAASRELDAVASMLPEDDARTLRWTEMLAAATGGGGDAGQFVDGLRSALRRITSAVSLATPPNVTLSSRSGSLRLQLRNDESTPLYVRVTVNSPKITTTDRADVVELLPGSTTDVKVPVRARTNGSFPVDIRVTTPAGRLQVVSPTVITARVRAVAGLGQLVSITLLLVLVAWWWTSWRRRREAAVAAGTVSDQ